MIYFQRADLSIYMAEAETGYIREEGAVPYRISYNKRRVVKLLKPEEAIEAFSDCFRCPFYELVPCSGLHDRAFCTFDEKWIDGSIAALYVCGGNWHNCPKLKSKGLK